MTIAAHKMPATGIGWGYEIKDHSCIQELTSFWELFESTVSIIMFCTFLVSDPTRNNLIFTPESR